MADLATPSAATMSTSDAQADTTVPSKDKTQRVKPEKPEKPEKPDEDTFNKELANARKELDASQEKLNALNAKLDAIKPGNKDSPSAQRSQGLRTELSSIRQQQAAKKTSRTSFQDKISSLDAQLKSRMAEQKTARSRVSFKSVDDIDREIQRLDQQVESSKMKIVEEKKALADISMLRKQRKAFSGFDEAQKQIDDVKAQISELRKRLDDPESKALSDRYTEIQKELDAIKAENDESFKNLSALREDRNKARADQHAKYSAMKDIRSTYYEAKKAYADYEHEAYRQRKERQRAEREEWDREKRKKIADEKLEQASLPAYSEQIFVAETLIRYFDPSSAAAKVTSGPGKFAAAPQRTVTEEGMKGMRLSSKKDRDEDEDNYFVGSSGKKGKKGRKVGAAASPAPAEGKYSLDIGTIEKLAELNVDPPMNHADVPSVVEKLQEKLKFWKDDQDRKTKENIARAQKEIDQLDSQVETSSPAPRGHTDVADPTRKNDINQETTNGANSGGEAELAREQEAAAGVTEDLKKTKLDDEQVPDEKSEEEHASGIAQDTDDTNHEE